MKFREEKIYFKNYDNLEDEVWCQLWQYIKKIQKCILKLDLKYEFWWNMRCYLFFSYL